jgi:hypothetical protein
MRFYTGWVIQRHAGSASAMSVLTNSRHWLRRVYAYTS